MFKPQYAVYDHDLHLKESVFIEIYLYYIVHRLYNYFQLRT